MRNLWAVTSNSHQVVSTEARNHTQLPIASSSICKLITGNLMIVVVKVRICSELINSNEPNSFNWKYTLIVSVITYIFSLQFI